MKKVAKILEKTSGYLELPYFSAMCHAKIWYDIKINAI